MTNDRFCHDERTYVNRNCTLLSGLLITINDVPDQQPATPLKKK